jgi:hypothetical protein
MRLPPFRPILIGPILIGPVLITGALLALAGCAAPPRSSPAAVRADVRGDDHVPPFARVPYQPLSRAAVVAIAVREWRLFDKPVDDDPPDSRPPPLPQDKPERWEGYWQRVGEYWWIGLDPDSDESAWTGMHDGDGDVFPASDDGQYAWSAAFVSYVFRIAGAGAGFPYAASHSDYIDIAAQMTQGTATGWLLRAQPPDGYAPQPGDLICMGRGKAARLRYEDLPAGHFPGHCDIVVSVAPGQLSVIGGNVDDAVTMKHVPITQDGKLATPDGTVLDPRYPWMVVLQVMYPAVPVS